MSLQFLGVPHFKNPHVCKSCPMVQNSDADWSDGQVIHSNQTKLTGCLHQWRSDLEKLWVPSIPYMEYFCASQFVSYDVPFSGHYNLVAMWRHTPSVLSGGIDMVTIPISRTLTLSNKLYMLIKTMRIFSHHLYDSVVIDDVWYKMSALLGLLWLASSGPRAHQSLVTNTSPDQVLKVKHCPLLLKFAQSFKQTKLWTGWFWMACEALQLPNRKAGIVKGTPQNQFDSNRPPGALLQGSKEKSENKEYTNSLHRGIPRLNLCMRTAQQLDGFRIIQHSDNAWRKVDARIVAIHHSNIQK